MHEIGAMAFSLFFLLLTWGVGEIILPLRLPLPNGTRGVTATAVGGAIVSFWLTILAAFHLFNATAIRLVIALVGVALLWAMIRRLRRKIAFTAPGQAEAALLAGLLIFYLPALLMAAAPPFMRDELVYHLASARRFLAAGGLVYQPGNFFFAFPKAQEMLAALLLGNGGETAAQAFGVWQQLAATWGLYALARSQGGKAPALVAALSFATLPTAVCFSGCGYVEPAISLGLVAALTVLFGRRESEDPALVLCLGLLAGWLIALKYTGLLYAGILGLMLLFVLRRQGWRNARRTVGLYVLALTPGLFWYARNWLLLGNPVFPFAYLFFGGAGWDAGRALAYGEYLRAYGMGRGLTDYLLLPWRMAMDGRFDSMVFDGHLGPIVLVTLLVALGSLATRRDRRLSGALVAVALSFLFFAVGSQQSRFYLPTQIFAVMAGLPSLVIFLHWIEKKAPRYRLSLALLFYVLVGWNLYAWLAEARQLNFYRVVPGFESREEFLARNVPGYPALRWIDRNLPPSARLLYVLTGNYAYYSHRPYVADSFIEDFTLRRYLRLNPTPETAAAALIGDGFTHLLVNRDLLEKSLPPEEKKLFSLLDREYLRLIRGDYKLTLYQIVPSPAAKTSR